VAKPYWDDGTVTLYLGDCREVTEWLAAHVLVTDPPYGRGWRSGSGMTNSHGRGRGSIAHGGIAGDDDTTTRDEALARWGDRPAIVFGDPLIARPAGAVQVLGYAKPIDAGIKGARAGFRRDLEEIYLLGPWPAGTGGRSSVLRTGGLVAGPRGVGTRNGHPHAKPVDLMEQLIEACPPPSVIADPFAGAGSTLVAARNLGRRAIGVELEERYCERAALRLSQMVLEAS
jgi:hypothetical protein